MIKFRQKSFDKKFRLRKVGKWAVEQAKTTNPAMLAISGTGAGYGIANYSVNKKRKEADQELREEQIKATKELAEALKKIEGLETREAKKHARNIRRAYKKADPDDQHPYITEKAKQAIFYKKK